MPWPKESGGDDHGGGGACAAAAAQQSRRYQPRQRAPSRLVVAEDLITVDNDLAYNALIERSRVHEAAFFGAQRDAEEQGALARCGGGGSQRCERDRDARMRTVTRRCERRRHSCCDTRDLYHFHTLHRWKMASPDDYGLLVVVTTPPPYMVVVRHLY